MAPFALRSLQSGRRFAQLIERPAPQAGAYVPSRARDVVEGTSNTPRLSSMLFVRAIMAGNPTDGGPEPVSLPGLAAGLAGVCTFAGVGLLLLAGWNFYKWKQRKKSTAPHVKVRRDLWSIYCDEKLGGSRSLGLPPSLPTSPSVMWKPAKISPWIDPRLPKKPPPALSSVTTSSATFMDANGVPVYAEGAGVDEKGQTQTTPHPAVLKFKDTNALINGPRTSPPLFPQPTRHDTSPRVITSSSTQSWTKGTLPPLVESPLGSLNEKDPASLPRLVTAVQTFPVTLHDELEVKEGEVLRLLQEFKDGWSLCQRVGPPDAEKGAVPLCCLAERPDGLLDAGVGSTRPPSIPRPVHKQSYSTSEIPSVEVLKRARTLGPSRPIKRSSSFVIGVDYRVHHKQPRTVRA